MEQKEVVKNIIEERDMLNTLPASLVMGTDGIKDAVIGRRTYVIDMMERYVDDAKEPHLLLTGFNKCGSQYIADFSVSDKAKPVENRYNWHLQNTSQWLFAGAIVVDERDKRVSVHT